MLHSRELFRGDRRGYVILKARDSSPRVSRSRRAKGLQRPGKFDLGSYIDRKLKEILGNLLR